MYDDKSNFEGKYTVVENHLKSLILHHCERSEQRLSSNKMNLNFQAKNQVSQFHKFFLK